MKPCINAARLRQALIAIAYNLNSFQQNTNHIKCKKGMLMQCYAIKSIAETALEKPCRNVDRAECDTIEHAAAVFARETGHTMPENHSDAGMILWMNAFSKWLFEVRK